MKLASRLRSFLSALTMRRRMEREMEDEWQFHLDARVDALVASGLPRIEAQQVARAEFGDPLRWKEEGREARGLRLIHELQSDIQYALRQMRRTPTVTVVITATLAIAIGANTAIFSLVDAVLLKTLPVPHPEELKQLVWVARRSGFHSRYNGSARPNAAGERVATSFAYTVFTEIRDRTTTFSDLFCFSELQQLSVTAQGGAQLVEGQFVSGTFFRGLGVAAILGRTITADDDRSGAPASAVISHGFWQRTFGGATDVLGQSITVNGTPVMVAGVTPPSFFGIRPGSRPDVMLPLSLQSALDASTSPETFTRPDYWSFEVMGRVKTGVHDARAQAETEALVRQAILATPPAAPYDLPRIVLDSGSQGLGDLRREFSRPLRILMAVVGAILLIACANIAGLLIVRASAREREMGTRLALGAGRPRLVGQLVTESVVLAAAGGSLGFALAYGLRQFLLVLVTEEGASTVNLDMTVDARVLMFTAGTCLATGIACGLLPALRATGVDVASLIGRSLSGTLARASRLSSGKVLVVVQVALSLVLLVGAGLFVRTLLNLRSEPLGFQPEGLLLFRVNPTQSGYREERLNDFYERAVDEIARVPGVRSASLSRYAILAGGATSDGIGVPGTEPKTGVHIHYVAPRYFETMGIPLLLGRDVGWRDRERTQRVVVINEALARKLFGNVPPLGQRLMHPRAAPADVMEVIGVAADAKFATLRQAAPPTIYVPYRIRPQRLMTFAVRTTGNPEALVGSIRDAVAAVDPSVPIFDVWTQEVQIDRAIRQERLFANLVSGFALLALLLSCLGIYGTLAYSVARRTPEIGLRMALGAGRRDVVGLVLRESAWPVLIGLLVGIAGAAATARVIQNMLFGVTHNDIATLAIAVIMLAGSALVAAWLPSARASRVEPMCALRYE